MQLRLISKRQLATVLFRRPLPIFDLINRNVTFQQFVPKAFARAQMLPWRGHHEFFKYLDDALLHGSAIDYLEFGVFKGKTINAWASLNANARSRFFGFDSFEGLPDDWNRSKKKGAFSTEGQIPIVNDHRVTFVKGLFQETLPGFLNGFRSSERLVVLIDSDLYSSALFVLTSLDRWLVPGSIVIFDEFYDLRHEFAAWCDYSNAYSRSASGICFTPGYTKVALLMQ